MIPTLSAIMLILVMFITRLLYQGIPVKSPWQKGINVLAWTAAVFCLLLIMAVLVFLLMYGGLGPE